MESLDPSGMLPELPYKILLFATLAIELKRKAPNAHTFLEIIRALYGVYAHLVFTVFGLMTNVLVCSSRP